MFVQKSRAPILIKSTPAGVNFTNILLVSFLYKSKFFSFSLITDWLCDFLAKGYRQKMRVKMLVKLTPGG